MQLLPLKRNINNPRTAGSEYNGAIYVYSVWRNCINVVPVSKLYSFKQKYFDNPVWYVQ